MSCQHGNGVYQTGAGYDMSDTRAGESSGYGFHGQKQGATLPSLRNGVEVDFDIGGLGCGGFSGLLTGFEVTT